MVYVCSTTWCLVCWSLAPTQIVLPFCFSRCIFTLCLSVLFIVHMASLTIPLLTVTCSRNCHMTHTYTNTWSSLPTAHARGMSGALRGSGTTAARSSRRYCLSAFLLAHSLCSGLHRPFISLGCLFLTQLRMLAAKDVFASLLHCFRLKFAC